MIAGKKISLTLRDALIPLMKVAADAEAGACKVIDLLEEIKYRYATTDIDKIYGITYLL